MSASEPLRLAMWSGPRNISTAMMRAWENRSDCTVSDEPLYAHYLASTGADHPAAEQVIAQGETDWRRVVASLLGPVPEAKPVWYQKHMSHHLLPKMDRDWIHQLTNVFLIRDPSDVVASYIKSRATVTAADIGLQQEAELFDEVAQKLGGRPVGGLGAQGIGLAVELLRQKIELAAHGIATGQQSAGRFHM